MVSFSLHTHLASPSGNIPWAAAGALVALITPLLLTRLAPGLFAGFLFLFLVAFFPLFRLFLFAVLLALVDLRGGHEAGGLLGPARRAPHLCLFGEAFCAPVWGFDLIRRPNQIYYALTNLSYAPLPFWRSFLRPWFVGEKCV